MSRIRSRQLETGSIPERVLRAGAVQRSHIANNAVGPDQIAPGAIIVSSYAPQSIKEQHLDPTLIPRETVTFHPEPGAAVTAQMSDAVPVRRGGQPIVLVQLTSAFTTAGEMDLFRNGSVVATLTLSTGSTQINLGRPGLVEYDTLDTVQIEVTDAGAGGVGMLVDLWF